MADNETCPVRSSLHGTLWVPIVELLALCLGFLIFVFLGRRLGPEGYGLYSLAAVLILWIEWGIGSFFDKASVKLISETKDWSHIATSIIRFQFFLGVIIAVFVYLFAGVIAGFFHEPELALYIRVFSLDIPISCLAQSHANVLSGIAWFRRRAITTFVRWLAKLLLAILLVQLGFSVRGALVANIGASVIELAIIRFWIRPGLLRGSGYPVRQLFISYGMPLFIQSLCLRLFGRLDLFMLKALGGTAAEAGIYSAAQNLSFPIGMLGATFSIILLSTLSRTLGMGETDLGRRLMTNSLRIVFWALPLAAILPWISSDLVVLILGAEFRGAGVLFFLLAFGALSTFLFMINISILIASGKTYTTVILTVPMVAAAIACHMIVIPRFGLPGASSVTAAVSFVAALGSVIAVFRLWRVLPPAGTVYRSMTAAAISCLVSALWPVAGIMIIVKTFVIMSGAACFFILLGEFTADDLSLFRSMISVRRRQAAE